MLPPRLIRRLALAPLVVVIAACLVVLTPPVALLSAASGLVRRLTGRGHRPRLLRVVFLALTWSVGETATLTVLLGLWIVSGFGGRLDTEPYRTRHYAVMEWFLNLIYRVARRSCGLQVEVAAPPDEPPADDRPIIVLSRHAGPGDSLLLVHHLLTVCQRRPRVVMKATLQLDPSLDIVANRVPNAFLHRRSGGPRPAQAAGRADQAAGRRPWQPGRPPPLPRRQELDPAPVAPRHRAPAPSGPCGSGQTGGGDAQPAAAPYRRGLRRDRRMPGRRRDLRGPYRP